MIRLFWSIEGNVIYYREHVACDPCGCPYLSFYFARKKNLYLYIPRIRSNGRGTKVLIWKELELENQNEFVYFKKKNLRFPQPHLIWIQLFMMLAPTADRNKNPKHIMLFQNVPINSIVLNCVVNQKHLSNQARRRTQTSSFHAYTRSHRYAHTHTHTPVRSNILFFHSRDSIPQLKCADAVMNHNHFHTDMLDLPVITFDFFPDRNGHLYGNANFSLYHISNRRLSRYGAVLQNPYHWQIMSINWRIPQFITNLLFTMKTEPIHSIWVHTCGLANNSYSNRATTTHYVRWQELRIDALVAFGISFIIYRIEPSRWEMMPSTFLDNISHIRRILISFHPRLMIRTECHPHPAFLHTFVKISIPFNDIVECGMPAIGFRLSFSEWTIHSLHTGHCTLLMIQMSLTEIRFLYISQRSHREADEKENAHVHGHWSQQRKDRDEAQNALAETLNEFNNRNGHNSEYSIYRIEIFGLSPRFTLFYNFWLVISSTHGINRERKL